MLEFARLAVETVGRALPYFSVGPVFRGPAGGPVDIVVLYDGLAVDIVHYDPVSDSVSPKGRPVHYAGPVDTERVRRTVARVLRESVALEGAEFREPERAWVVPVAWRYLIILHVRVSWNGERILLDPHLQARLYRW